MRMHISKDIARLKLQEYDNDTLINYILAISPVDFEKLDEIEKELKKRDEEEKRDINRELIKMMMEGENT